MGAQFHPQPQKYRLPGQAFDRQMDSGWGRERDAKAALEYVALFHPIFFYYAWRSAATLGLDVGNFNTFAPLANS